MFGVEIKLCKIKKKVKKMLPRRVKLKNWGISGVSEIKTKVCGYIWCK